VDCILFLPSILPPRVVFKEYTPKPVAQERHTVTKHTCALTGAKLLVLPLVAGTERTRGPARAVRD